MKNYRHPTNSEHHGLLSKPRILMTSIRTSRISMVPRLDERNHRVSVPAERGKKVSFSPETISHIVCSIPTAKPCTDPQPRMMQEERSPQARSREVVHKSFHRVSGQNSAHLHSPMSGKERAVPRSTFSHCPSLPLPRLPRRNKAQGSLIPNVTPKPFYKAHKASF